MTEQNAIHCNGTIYVVKQGDTLYNIAKKYALNINVVMQNNPFLNVFDLKVGDEVCLPLKTTIPIENIRPYVVKSQQSVKDILENKQLTFEELAKYNQIVQQLSIPEGTILLIPDKS